MRVGDRILTVNRMGQKVFSDVVYLPHGTNHASTTFTVLNVTVTLNSKEDFKGSWEDWATDF